MSSISVQWCSNGNIYICVCVWQFKFIQISKCVWEFQKHIIQNITFESLIILNDAEETGTLSTYSSEISGFFFFVDHEFNENFIINY